jgi:uncharacterized Zn finger protein (UPF0148 family)
MTTRRKRCERCNTLSYDWERYNGETRCYPCGRKAREEATPHLFKKKRLKKAVGSKARERDEVLEQCKRAEYDAAQETIKNSILKGHWITACRERDQWRECAEMLSVALKELGGGDLPDYAEFVLSSYHKLREATK